MFLPGNGFASGSAGRRTISAVRLDWVGSTAFSGNGVVDKQVSRLENGEGVD